jgi:hypothetical protein
MNPIDQAHDALHALGWSAEDESIAILVCFAWLVTCACRGHFVLETALMQTEVG